MFGVEYMTEDEKKGTLQYINDMDKATKIDADTVLEVMKETDIFINDLIHINMLKCEVLIDMKKPIYPFNKEDYIAICSFSKEEERRKKLSEILSIKDREYKMENKNLANALKIKHNPQEPVMDCVAKIDAEVGGIAADRLRSLIERIEHLEEEKRELQSDIRDIFAEAKSAGFDVKAMRTILKLRKMDAADRDEEEFIINAYRKALSI